jgi:hypothetical protein
LDFAGIDNINDRIIDGVSMKKTLTNHVRSQRKSILFYRQREIYAARLNDFKAHFITQGAYDYNGSNHYNARGYVKRNEKKILDKPLLYNLNDDPSEKFNIANQYPEVIEKIKELIDDHNKNLNAPIDLLSNRTGVEF